MSPGAAPGAVTTGGPAAVGEPLPLDQPFFIVGDGRSGTTLLRSLLSAHPRLTVTPETHYMERAESEGGLAAGAPPDFDAFWQRYTDWSRFADLGVDADRCLELVDSQGDRTFEHVFVAVLAAYAERAGKPRVGEKTPGHSRFLDRLLEWFPEARAVVLRRDPRAVVASQMLTPWVESSIRRPSLRHGWLAVSRASAFVDQALEWSEIYEVVVPPWADDDRVLIVSYEALVGDTESELKAICTFLGEDFDPNMTTGRSNDNVFEPVGTKPSMAGWVKEHHERSLAPVSTDSMDRWRHQLNRAQVGIVEGICRSGMRQAGYQPSQPAVVRAAGAGAASLFTLAVRAETAALSGARRLRRLRRVRRLLLDRRARSESS